MQSRDPIVAEAILAQFGAIVLEVRCPANPTWNQEQMFLHVIRLAARSFPAIVVKVGEDCPRLGQKAEALAKSIQPGIALNGNANIVVEISGQDATAYRLDCSGWRISVATPNQPLTPFPEQVKHPSTPMLAAAVCVGLVTQNVLNPGSINTNLLFNTWANGQDDGPLVPATLDLERTSIIGLGSIGSTVVGLLGAWDLRGTLDLVDQEKFENRNLRRYPFLERTQLNVAKSELAEDVLSPRGATTRAYTGKVEHWVHALGAEEKLPLLVVSCDTMPGRQAAADAFARFVVSATVDGTQAHVFRSNQAWGMCSVCKYVPKGKSPHQEEYVIAVTNLPQARVKALTWHDSGDMNRMDRLTPHDCRAIETHLGLAANSLDSWLGQRILDMLAKHQARLYSAIKVPKALSAANVTLPTPTGSAAAGALLLGEAIKIILGIARTDFESYSDIRLEVQTGELTWFASIRDQFGRCLCGDLRRRSWHQVLYEDDYAP